MTRLIAAPFRFRAAALAAAPVLLLLGVSVAVPASAASTPPVLGTLTVAPLSGTVDDVPAFTTSGPCPSSAVASRARILGPGFPKYGQNMSATAPGNTSKTKPFQVLSAYTLKDVAALTYPAVTYKGNYRVEVVCVGTLGKQLGLFTGAITFVNPVQWKTASQTAPVKPGPTVSLPRVTTGPASSTPKPSASASASPSPSTSAPSTPAPTGSSTDDAVVPGDGGPTELAAPAASSSDSASPWLLVLVGVIAGGAVAGGAVYLVGRRAA